MATQTITLQPFHTAVSVLPPTSQKHNTPSPSLPLPTPSDTTITTTLPTPRAILITTQLCLTLFLASFCNGIIIIALPSISTSLSLPSSLLVWPTSAYYLAAGTCLLLFGSLSDVLGSKLIHLLGCFFGALFTLLCGLSRSGNELIAFRALMGVTNAAVTPSAIAIVSAGFGEGRPRNMGFACLGFSQPLGFCFGLVMGGVFVDGVGWRPALYFAAAAGAVLGGVGVWVIPGDGTGTRGVGNGNGNGEERERGFADRLGMGRAEGEVSRWKRVKTEIDWVGLLLAMMGLAMLSYVLATLSADINSIRLPSSIVLLVITGLCLPAFAGWMHYQEKRNRTTLIPNSLWKSHVFTSACIMVLLTNALTNCMELYSSLFFQQVQLSTATLTSLQVLPSLLAGVLTSILTGLLVHRIPILTTVFLSSLLSAAAPLLMALIRTNQPYWENAFFAQILTPISCDIMFTVGLLIVADTYPRDMQAVGGAVFNTCAQIGGAVGLSVTQVVASSVSRGAGGHASGSGNGESPEELMRGYRVAFWTMFGWMVVVCVVCVVGMKRVGGVGLKRD